METCYRCNHGQWLYGTTSLPNDNYLVCRSCQERLKDPLTGRSVQGLYYFCMICMEKGEVFAKCSKCMR